MPLISSPRSVGFQSNFSGRPSSTMGTLVTAGGSSHTLGSSYTQILAATEFDAHSIEIIIHQTASSAVRTDALLNLYIGASGSEQTLISGLLAGWAGQMSGHESSGKSYWFPIRIPAGSRISAKSQALISSDQVYVIVRLYGGGYPPRFVGSGVESLGVSTANSNGTSVTPGTTSEGSAVTIGTATKNIKFILPVAHGTLADTASTNQTVSFDILSGGVALPGLSDFLHHVAGHEHLDIGSYGRFCDIASGTSLQLRAQGGSSTVENIDACIYGVY